jgi:predicted double-glycine peptidase
MSERIMSEHFPANGICKAVISITNLLKFILEFRFLYPKKPSQGRKCGIGSLLIVCFLAFSSNAAPSTQTETVNPDPAITVVRHTLKELRDQNVVKQQLDYSCGAAALATLISGYFGEATSEKELLDLLNIRLNTMSDEEKTRKQRNGFSLLDLKHVAQQKGYKAAGFKLTIEQLRQLAAPVIVFVLPMGYHHFAVLRGIVDGRVYLADPGRGNLRMSVARFEDEYGGIIFVLGKAGEENIKQYPLQIGRIDDYAKPEARNVFYRSIFFNRATVDFASRSHLP